MFSEPRWYCSVKFVKALSDMLEKLITDLKWFSDNLKEEMK